MSQECPACGAEIVSFLDLPDDVRKRLESATGRQRQSVDHRREKHTVCPECELEIHGCGQPYAAAERAHQ